MDIIHVDENEDVSAMQYLHDFVHMVYKPTADREDQLVSGAIFKAARELFAESGARETGEEFVLDVSAIHVAHARIQERLNCFAQLVHAQPSIVARLLEIIPPEDNEMVLDGVALQLCLAELSPTEEELEDPQQRLLWCNKVLAIRAPMENMKEKAPNYSHREHRPSRYGNKTVAVLRNCRSVWQRASAVRLYVEHVCPPGSISHPAEVKNIFRLWKAIGDDCDFSNPQTMRVVERFLVNCSEAVSQRSNSYGVSGCSICLESLKDPVEMPCQHTCCLICATQWLSKEHSCPLCRQAVPNDFRPKTTTSLRQAVQEHTDFRRRCNSFFMELVTLFCFGESRQDLDPALFGMLMSYVIRARAQTKDFSPFPEHGVDATPVVRSFLLQQLLRSSGTEVTDHLTRYLNEAQRLRPELDHVMQVCLLFVQCKEDALISTYSRASSLLEVTIKVAQQMCSEATEVLTSSAISQSHAVDVNKLEGVAKARYALTLAAGFMYTCRVEGKLCEPQVNNELRKLFEDCRRMCLKTLSPAPRMYLLKQLARRHGIDAITKVSERKELEWVLPPDAREKQAEDMIPDRFVVYGEHYREIREAVAKAVLSGSTSEMITVLENMAVEPLKREILLLLALYREATMCNAFTSQHRKLTTKAHQSLCKFIQDDKQMAAKARDMAGHLLDNSQGSGFTRLAVTQGQSPLDRTLAEIVVHVTAMLSCVRQNTLLEPLQQMVENPALMKNIYFPTMPDDNLDEAMSGLQETGAWYECPRGHPYFIGDCGRAVEVKTCPECKVNIGGRRYNLEPGNVQARRGDRTSKGHILGQPNTRPLAAAPERTMSPVVLSVVRLLLHSTMVMGACSHPAAMVTLIRPLVPQEAVTEFLWQHLSRDLEVLARAIGRSPDDAALTIHLILAEISSVLAKHPVQGRYDLSNKNGRREWEAAFTAAFVTPVLRQDLEENVQRCLQLLVGDKRLGNDPLMRQLYEIDVPDEIMSKGIPPTCPVLWRYRAQVTVAHVSHTFQEVVASNDPSKCRVLALFLRREPKLSAVCYLPDIVRLQQLLMDRFHRRIDRAEAERFKLRDFLKSLPGPSKQEFSKLILSFKTAWNLVRSYLDQAGRLKVPSDYCEMQFDSNSPLAILLPSTSGIGICSQALVYFLCSIHNEFLHSYHHITGGNIKEVDHISLLDATSSHLVAYDHDKDLMPLILAHCNYSLEVGKGTVVDYNWVGLERQLIDRFIRGRPLIDYKDERFAFSKDTGAETVFASLKLKIHQVPLSVAISSNILSEYHSNLSDVCDSLTSLDIAIGFLSSAGGRQDMLISDYLHNVLRMRTKAGLQSCKANQFCQLRHLISLWQLLNLERARIMLRRKQDPFDKLPDVFKERMSEKQLIRFNKFWNESGRQQLNPDSYISQILQLIVLNLKQEATGIENMSISDYLRSKDLEEIPALESTDADVHLKNVVHAWQRVLEINDCFHETRAAAMA